MILRSNHLCVNAVKASILLPDFLVPALCTPHRSRPFTSTSRCQSRIGRAPFATPQGVDLRILNPPAKRKQDVTTTELPKTLEITGPLGMWVSRQQVERSADVAAGKISLQLPPYMSFQHDEETRKGSLSILDQNDRKQREMWGTTRAYLSNHILGVSEGHTAILRLVGVGYRATVEPSAVSVQPQYPGQLFVSLKVGYSHPIELGVPLGMKASTPQPTRILLEGPEKEVVKQFAANIRKWRVPEPYKGKGIFVNGETIKLKAKKIK